MTFIPILYVVRQPGAAMFKDRIKAVRMTPVEST